MMMHKLGTVVVNNTDNLLISAFVGVVSVGIYSNYYLLIGSVRQVLDQVFAGITASVGNLGATEDQGKIREILSGSGFTGLRRSACTNCSIRLWSWLLADSICLNAPLS